MKVLLASQFFERFTDRLDFTLAIQLRRVGVEVVMLFPSSVNKTETINGLRIYRVKPTPIVRSFSRKVLKGSYILDLFIRSLAIVKRERIDLLYAFFAIPPGLAMTLSKKATGRPLVVCATGDDVSSVKEIDYGFRLNPLANRLVKYVLQNADQVIAPSHLFEELAVSAGAERRRTTVIPWGASLDKSLPSEENAQETSMRKKLGLSPEDKVILSLCRHARVKGLGYLLRAMPRILSEQPNSKLVLAGTGKETNKLKSIARNLEIDQKVIFPGFVHGKEKTELMATANVFIQPSLSDAFSLSVLEAMTSRKPIVITDRVGLSDFLRNGECGFTVKAGDSDVLADAILRLLADDNLRSRLGEQARKKAREFNWDKIMKKLLDVCYKALVRSSSKAEPG